MEDLKIEKIRWIDSYGTFSDWIDVGKLNKYRNHHVDSAGFVVYEDNDILILAPNLSQKDDALELSQQCCGYIIIPKIAIVERNKLIIS